MGSAEEMAMLPLHAGFRANSLFRGAPNRRTGKVDATAAQRETRNKLVFHRVVMHKIAMEHLIYW